MKKSLKRRFVAGAMLSFLIMLILIVGSIGLLIYREQEQRADRFVDTLLSEDTRLSQPPPPNWFGYQFTRPSFPAGFYVIAAKTSGEISSIDRNGILQDEEEDIAKLAEQIIQTRATEGKSGSYKFRAAYQEGEIRLVLLDQTAQIHSLYNVIRMGALVGAACLLVLFIILQPIAGYLIGAWMRRTEQQKQFITNAGHELKTPVAIIMSNAEALELIEGENKYSRNIREQSARLDRLIQQLLMIARVDEARFQIQNEMLDLSALLEEALHAFDESLTARGMWLKKQITPSCFVRGCHDSMRQMIYVLMDNTVRYGCENSCIHAELQRLPRQVRLTLTNSVDKLPECEPSRLSERFYRGSKARTQAEQSGCGVGLSAAQTIVRLHRGSMVIDYPNSNTFRVVIMLPVKN